MPFPLEFTWARRSLDLFAGTTMIRLKPAHRRVLVAHVPELANIAIGSFLFGQFLTDRPYSVVLAIVGVATWFALIGFTFLVANDG
jgi:hypothetical protein